MNLNSSKLNLNIQSSVCQHERVRNFGKNLNCRDCGVLILEDDVAYKSDSMKFGVFFDPYKCYKSAFKKRMDRIQLEQGSEYFKQRSQLIDFIWDIGTKLRLVNNTIHLAIYFIDISFNKLEIDKKDFELYASTCVMLAAKSSELDERIPFISKLKRYSGIFNSVQEVTKAEGKIVQLFNWNLQCVTLIDILEMYLSFGCIFGNDTYNQELIDTSLKEKELNDQVQSQKQDNKQIKDLTYNQIMAPVQRLESDYIRLSNMIIRDTFYHNYDLNVLAAASLVFLREMIEVKPAFNQNLGNIFNLEESDIQDCLKDIVKKFSNHFQPRKRPSIIIQKNQAFSQDENVQSYFTPQLSSRNQIGSVNNEKDSQTFRKDTKQQQQQYLKQSQFSSQLNLDNPNMGFEYIGGSIPSFLDKNIRRSQTNLLQKNQIPQKQSQFIKPNYHTQIPSNQNTYNITGISYSKNMFPHQGHAGYFKKLD